MIRNKSCDLFTTSSLVIGACSCGSASASFRILQQSRNSKSRNGSAKTKIRCSCCLSCSGSTQTRKTGCNAAEMRLKMEIDCLSLEYNIADRRLRLLNPSKIPEREEIHQFEYSLCGTLVNVIVPHVMYI